MAAIVSILSIRALLQDVNTSQSSTPEEANTSMLDETVMDRAYYMGLQSTQPAALVPLEDDPLAGKRPNPA